MAWLKDMSQRIADRFERGSVMRTWSDCGDKHVVFIDDGVNSPALGVDLVYDLEVTGGNIAERKDQHSPEEISHGTICAAIVKKYCPNVKISSVKILKGKNRRGSIDALSVALQWCIDNKPDVVNISAGTIEKYDEKNILTHINRLSYFSIIVAALSNRNIITYPASFSSVLGVKRGNKDGVAITVSARDGADITCQSVHYIEAAGKSFHTPKANSYAAPYAVAGILSSKEELANGEAARRFFLSEYGGCANQRFVFMRPDWIYSAIVISECDIPAGIFPFFIASYIPLNRGSALHDSIDAFKAMDFDTFVFIFHKVFSLSEKREFVLAAHAAGKSVVVIDAETHFYDSPMYYPETFLPAGKHWEVCDSFQSTSKHNKVIDIPFIVAYCQSYVEVLVFCQNLTNYLEEQDYSPLLFSNSPLVALSFGYPVCLQSKGYVGHMGEIGKTRSADILLLAVAGEFSEKLDFKALAAPESVDMFVHLSGDEHQIRHLANKYEDAVHLCDEAKSISGKNIFKHNMRDESIFAKIYEMFL